MIYSLFQAATKSENGLAEAMQPVKVKRLDAVPKGKARGQVAEKAPILKGASCPWYVACRLPEALASPHVGG
jgi:hypothetical protein